MIEDPPHARNGERFAQFHELQKAFASRLAMHPQIVRAWLDRHPVRAGGGGGGGPAKSWRMSRLNRSRRLELEMRVRQAEGSPGDPAGLSAWLLASAPVGTYLEMADMAKPNLASVDPDAAAILCGLLRVREELLMANLGLAKTVVRQWDGGNVDEIVGAASYGLLDAIDRYVPGERAARFSYFAGYWIRYHVSRHLQKHSTVVSFPIHQHRIGRKIERLISDRLSQGLEPPSDDDLRASLKISANAYQRHGLKPKIVPLDHACDAEDETAVVQRLCDPASGPIDEIETSERSGRLDIILKRHSRAADRLMLAYAMGVGAVAEAAEEYMADVCSETCSRLDRL